MATYHLTVTDTAGVFTGVIRRGGTAASGGTVLTGDSGDNTDGTTLTHKHPRSVIHAMHNIIANDRAAGN